MSGRLHLRQIQVEDIAYPGQTRFKSQVDGIKDNIAHKITVLSYKYFSFNGLKRIAIKVRGSAQRKLLVKASPEGRVVGEIPVMAAKGWTEFTGSVDMPDGEHALCFCFEGRGKMDFLEFTLE